METEDIPPNEEFDEEDLKRDRRLKGILLLATIGVVLAMLISFYGNPLP